MASQSSEVGRPPTALRSLVGEGARHTPLSISSIQTATKSSSRTTYRPKPGATGGHWGHPGMQEVEAWIVKHLGQDYEWPGNIRELEQCVRSILIRKEYQPLRPRTLSVHEDFTRTMVSGTLTTFYGDTAP